jgi:hypothetical protein
MPLADTSEVQSVISAYFGADASGIPASFDLALWVGDIDTGVEFDYPGYARVTLTNDTTTFVNNGDGSVTAAASFPDATDQSTTDDADRWVLFNGTARVAWEFLDVPLAVDGAGTVEPISVTVYQPNPDLLGS